MQDIDIQALLEKIKAHNAKARQLAEHALAVALAEKLLEADGHKAGLLKKRLRQMIATVKVDVNFPDGAIFPEKPMGFPPVADAQGNMCVHGAVGIRHDPTCPYLAPFPAYGPCTCGAA